MSADRNRIWKERGRRRTAISEWVRGLRRDFAVDEVIDHVKLRMRSADAADKDSLTFELEMLLREAGLDEPARYDEALRLIDDMIERKPNDVLYPISKATLCFHSLNRPDKALECIDFALERAFRTKFFRRDALGTKARILLALGRGQELGQVLEQIMSLDDYREFPDAGRERDFVDRAPPGLIAADIVERYNRYYRHDQRLQARQDWLRNLRAEFPLEAMIDRVEARVHQADDEDKSQFAFSLGRLCIEAARYSDALRWFDNAMDWDPADPRPAIRKAIVFLANLDDPRAALAAIEPAVERAFRIGDFRRMALGVKARVLLKLHRGQEIGSILEQIMSLQMRPENYDIGRERDFVDDALPGDIPADVRARYDEFCPSVPLD